MANLQFKCSLTCRHVQISIHRPLKLMVRFSKAWNWSRMTTVVLPLSAHSSEFQDDVFGSRSQSLKVLANGFHRDSNVIPRAGFRAKTWSVIRATMKNRLESTLILFWLSLRSRWKYFMALLDNINSVWQIAFLTYVPDTIIGKGFLKAP